MLNYIRRILATLFSIIRTRKRIDSDESTKSDNLRLYNQKYKSDKRIKGGKEGLCPLCATNKQLILSHIVPKWAYKGMKEEGNIIGRYESIRVNTIEQDGSKHYLLCQECDQFLGDAENYVNILMNGTREEKVKLSIVSSEYIYEGLNFELIQRFLFGLAFKSHFATSAPFQNIKFSDEQISDIRNRINSPSFNDEDYVIIAMKFVSEKVKDINPKAIMIPLLQKGKEEFLSFLIGGWEWTLFFNKSKWVGSNILKIRLKSSGSIDVHTGDILEQRFINRVRSLSRRDRIKIERNQKK